MTEWRVRRGNGEGEDGAKVRVSLSSLLGRVRVRVRVRWDKGGEDGTRVRVRVQIFIALGRWSGDPVRSMVTVHPLMSGQVPNLLQWEVSGVDSGPQPQPQKGVQVGGWTLAGTQPSFLIWYTNEWTGLRPYLGISGGLISHKTWVQMRRIR